MKRKIYVQYISSNKSNLTFSTSANLYSLWPRWHLVGVVVDSSDICRNSRWLRGDDVGLVVDYHGVSNVVDYVDQCRHGQWLCGHDNDYADTFGKFWRLLSDFKGKIRQKKYIYIYFRLMATSTFYSRFTNTAWLLKKVLGCVYIPNLIAII